MNHKAYSAINIIGLSLGIAVTVLILLFVVHETSYDGFHQNKDRIFQAKSEVKYGDMTIYATALSAPFGPLAKEASVSIEEFLRIRKPGRVVIKSNDDTKYFEDHLIFADPSLFEVFSFKVINGSPSALGEPGRVLITPTIATKYFGKEYAIGRYITYNDSTQLEVAGLIEPPPSNSTQQFELVASFSTLGILKDENEVTQYNHDLASLGAYETYLLLEGAEAKYQVEMAISKIVKPSVNEKYFLEPLLQPPPHIDRLIIFSSGSPFSFSFVDQDYGRKFSNEERIGKLAAFFATLAVLISCLGLFGLASFVAEQRIKEIGIRKVLGATVSNLWRMLSIDFILLVIISCCIAIPMSALFMNNWLMQFQYRIPLPWQTFVGAVLGSISITLLTVSYQAVKAALANPVKNLKSE